MTEAEKLFEDHGRTFELAPGMTVEDMESMFFDDDALREAPEKVYRLDSNGHRYYYTMNEETFEPTFFVSVTTFIRQTTPTSPSLIKWMAEMGYVESKAYAAERALYGTFMHTQLARLLIDKVYDLDELKGKLKDYIESNQLPSTFINHADELKKDVLAFAQFMVESNVKPLAIEIVLTHPTDGYAGALDLACEMDHEVTIDSGDVYKSGPNKGLPRLTKSKERIKAIIDFKSGRQGFFEDAEIQLHAYKEMWNKHFKSAPIDRVFNWSPKAWRGKVPKYNLKDQTFSKSAKKLPYLVELARIEDHKRENSVVSCSGLITLDSDMISSNVKEFTLSELVKRRATKNVDPSGVEVKTTKPASVAKKQTTTRKKRAATNTTTPKKTKVVKKAVKRQIKDIDF